MTDNDERASLQELIAKYRSNLRHLEKQAADHGGESSAPLITINNLRSTREQIADLQAKLRRLDTSSRPDSQDSRSAISFGQGNNQQGMNVQIGGDVAGGDIIKDNTFNAGSAPVDLPRLRQLLVQHFNDGELRDLCFDLGVEYENLPGGGKADKARELVAYAQRHGVMTELLDVCYRQRPNAPWPGKPTTSDAAASTQTDSQPELQSSERGTQQEQAQTVTPTKEPPTHLTLLFQSQGDETHITWESPLLGSRTTLFTPPYTKDVLPLVIKALDAVQHLNHPLGGPQFKAEDKAILNGLGLWQNERVPPSAHKTVGQAIYRALGPDGKSALETVRSFSISQGVQISYVLRFPREAVSLAALPWEALWDEHQAVLLSRGNDVDSCERYMNIDRALPPPLAAGQKLHVLALTPTFGIPDKVRREERDARLATWDSLKEQELMTYDEVGGPLTVRKLTDYLRKAPRRPDIIHYFGHGIYKDGEGYLLFDSLTGDKPSYVSSTRLAAMLGDVRLMVILACESAMVEEEGGLLTGVAPALSLVTGAVVAMQLSVRITAATRFSEIFYDELLGLRHSLQDAVAEARQTLFFEEDDGASWYVPTLYIRSREQKPVYIVS